MFDERLKELLERYPFLSYGTMSGNQYIGIVQNADSQLLSMYLLNEIPTGNMRKLFLECGFQWWWESNRQIPINIFIKERFRPFRDCLKHFSRKDFNLEAGPIVSLHDTIARRVRKRQVTLVRRI